MSPNLRRGWYNFSGYDERFGFRPVGVFPGVGRKFDRFWDVEWFERPLRL